MSADGDRDRLMESSDLAGCDIEFVELDASLSSASFSPHPGSRVREAHAAAVPNSVGLLHLDGAVALGERAASGSGSDPPQAAACANDQDKLLRELIEKLETRGHGAHETCLSTKDEAAGADADADYVTLEPHEANEDHMTWSNSSVGSRFSFIVQRVHSDNVSDSVDVNDEPALAAVQDVDDREESDQASPPAAAAATIDQPHHALPGRGNAVRDQVAGRGALVREGIYEEEQISQMLTRHYKHYKNGRVNSALNTIAAFTLVLAVGIGIGHSIGSAREASLQQQIRDDQDSKLKELREDLLMCLRKQEDINQTIRKLNEIEAILVDAEHWRNEYEELLKLKVQAEDNWRQEQGDLVGQLDKANAELNSVKACHYDSEFMSRQELKLDSVHAKLQTSLEQKEQQLLDQQVQLAECKANATSREEATRSLKSAIDSKNRAIVLLKEQLLDRERELVRAGVSQAAAAAAASGTARQSSAAASHDSDDGGEGGSVVSKREASEGLTSCQRQLLRCLEQVASAEDSVRQAQSQLEQQTLELHSCQVQLEQQAVHARRHDHATPDGSAGSCHGDSAGSAKLTSQRCPDDVPHFVDAIGELAVRRCARLVRSIRERQPGLMARSSPGWTALDRSLRLFAVAFCRQCPQVADQRSADGVRDVEGGPNTASGEGMLGDMYRGASATMSSLLGAAQNSLQVANSSLQALANKSVALLKQATESAFAMDEEWRVSGKVGDAVADLKSQVQKVADAVASVWKKVRGKVEEPVHEEPAEEGGTNKQRTPVDVALFWSDFKQLRQLMSSIPEQAHLPNEASRTFEALVSFLQRYNSSELELPAGPEWQNWCRCQMAWWTVRLQSLAPTIDCSSRLTDWQLDMMEDDASLEDTLGFLPEASHHSQPLAESQQMESSSLPAAKGEQAEHTSSEWMFERAAERQFQRDTPDDWYWRRVKDMYGKVRKFFSSSNPDR